MYLTQLRWLVNRSPLLTRPGCSEIRDQAKASKWLQEDRGPGRSGYRERDVDDLVRKRRGTRGREDRKRRVPID